MHVIRYDSPERLKKLAGETENPAVKVRISAISLAMEGQSSLKIAAHLGCHRISVINWVKCYNRQGLTGVDATKQMGRPRKLSKEELKRLRDRVCKEINVSGTPKSVLIDGMIQILNEDYKIKYSRGRMYDLVNQLFYIN